MEIKWHDASKMLPAVGQDVLAVQINDNGSRVIIVAEWIDGCILESEEEFAEECKEDGRYYAPKGWYENQWNWGDYSSIRVQTEITHWAEMPELPAN